MFKMFYFFMAASSGAISTVNTIVDAVTCAGKQKKGGMPEMTPLLEMDLERSQQIPRETIKITQSVGIVRNFTHLR